MDSQDSIEEVCQLSIITSRGVFPQEYVCEREPVFCASSEMDPELPDTKEAWISLQRLNAGSSFLSQDERISESL